MRLKVRTFINEIFNFPKPKLPKGKVPVTMNFDGRRKIGWAELKMVKGEIECIMDLSVDICFEKDYRVSCGYKINDDSEKEVTDLGAIKL